MPTYVPAAWPHTGFIAFNAGRGIFADPDVRRAAALALDRSALAAVYAPDTDRRSPPPERAGSTDPHRRLRARARSGRGEAPHGWPRRLGGDADLRRLRSMPHGSPDRPRRSRADRDRRADPPALELRCASSSREPRATSSIGGRSSSTLIPPPSSSQMLLHDVPTGWLPAGVREDVERVSEMSGQARQNAATRLAQRLETEDIPLIAVGVVHARNGARASAGMPDVPTLRASASTSRHSVSWTVPEAPSPQPPSAVAPAGRLGSVGGRDLATEVAERAGVDLDFVTGWSTSGSSLQAKTAPSRKATSDALACTRASNVLVCHSRRSARRSTPASSRSGGSTLRSTT